MPRLGGGSRDAMNLPIESAPPTTWRDLERRTAQILEECGMEVAQARAVETARGIVTVDVHAIDGNTTPPSTIIVECELWRKRLPKNAVHAFRAVLSDTGANLGLIVSSTGFQSGAREAASHSNIGLLDWTEFEQTYVDPR
jgi:restriction system protein